MGRIAESQGVRVLRDACGVRALFCWVVATHLCLVQFPSFTLSSSSGSLSLRSFIVA